MTGDLGYSRETFSFALALQNLVWGITQPFTGWIADRYGTSKALLIGALAYVLGLVFMANSTTSVGLTLSAGVLIGIGLGGSSFAVIFGTIGRAFDQSKRSLVLGIAGTGASFGMFAMLPFGQYLLNSVGWFNALVVLAIACALMFPLSAGLIEQKDPLEEKARQLTVRMTGQMTKTIYSLGVKLWSFILRSNTSRTSKILKES
jgi:MFS family permease